MIKVHMCKTNSLVSSASTKIDLKSNLSIPTVCETVRYYIIERVNFVVKILYSITILLLTKF